MPERYGDAPAWGAASAGGGRLDGGDAQGGCADQVPEQGPVHRIDRPLPRRQDPRRRRHRAHFEVTYRPELYRPDDPDVLGARAAAGALLYGTATPNARQLAAGTAAWALVHGLATLWLNGNIPAPLGDDPEEVTRIVAAYLDMPEGVTAAVEEGSRGISPERGQKTTESGG